MKPVPYSWTPEGRKDYRVKNRDKILAYKRIRYEIEKPKINARNKAWYWANKERVRLRGIKYRKENADILKVKTAKYRESKRQELNTKQLARYYGNKDVHRIKQLEHRSKNRPIIRAKSRQRSLEITDGYAREMLSKYSPISAHEWPQELVDAKRAELLCMRMTGDKRYKSLSSTTVN